MPARALRPLVDLLHRRPWLAFVLMGAAFIGFGVTSINLYELFAANLTLIAEYGAVALADGALRQLFELIGSLALAAAFYVLFALCDRVLVRRLTEKTLAACDGDRLRR